MNRFPFFHASAGYTIGAALGRAVPRRTAQFVGSAISEFYGRRQPERAEVVRANLSLLRTEPVDSDLVRAVFTEFGRTMGDYFHLASRPAGAALELISEQAGFAHFDAVRKLGRGALLLTPHLSFFELGGAAAQAGGFPIVALTRAEATPALTRWRAAYRARWGVGTLEIGAEDQFVFLDVARRLEAGEFVAALVDRPNASKTFPVRLPGGTFHFSGAILLLAMARQCPVLPVTTVRLPDDTYRVEAHEPFLVERGERGSTSEILTRYCQRLADVFAPVLAAHPEQWFHFVPLNPPPDVGSD